MNLRDTAQGQHCTVRVPMECLRTTETVVLAHYRLVGISGAGMKSPDWLGAFACARCHDLIDGRARTERFTRDELHLMHLEGVARTQVIWVRQGLIIVAEAA